MQPYSQSFVNNKVNKAIKHIKSIHPDLKGTFYDVYVEQTNTEIKVPTYPKGHERQFQPTDEAVKDGTLLKAFVAAVASSEEFGTPASKRILASVKAPLEEHTNAVTGRSKTYTKRGSPVRYNIFDRGITGESFNRIYGAIETGQLELVGGGVFEVLTTGDTGIAMNVPLDNFWMRDAKGNKMKGRRRLPDGSTSEVEDRIGTFRPMFFLQAELDALPTRLAKEINRTDYVNKDEQSPKNIDTSESDEIQDKLSDQSQSATLKPEEEEPAAKTG
jgi:hypothetical protein